MGYAQLVFPSNPQAGQILKAIVKVLTGETNLANIEGLATSPAVGGYVYNSEIYNPSGHAWALEFPASLPANGNFNIQTATLRSQCLTVGKFKFIRLAIASSVGAFTEPAGGSNHTLTTNYRIYAQGLSAIDGSGNATNLTYRNSDGSSAFIAKGISTSEIFVIRMSWSNRHVFCSPYLSVSGASTFFGCFEFDENHLTQYSNSAPCLHVTGYGATSTLGNFATNDIGDHNVVSLLATYNPVTATTPGVRALTSTSTMHMSNIAAFGLASNVSTEYSYRKFKSNDKFKISTSPIFIDDAASQLGIINCSKYSKIFLYFNYTRELMTVISALDGSQYKIWNLFNSTNSSFSTIIVPYE
jgi:hypothetical protein